MTGVQTCALPIYNTAYHHGTRFQTAATRPLLVQFEDGSGLLPIHNVGLYAYGALPSGGLNLEYTVEIGNGRTYVGDEVQNTSDHTPGKSINVALRTKPASITGLELGVSAYRDRFTLLGNPVTEGPITQHIFAGYAVYRANRVEALNEFAIMRHSYGDRQGRSVSYVPGFYSQWSYLVKGA